MLFTQAESFPRSCTTLKVHTDFVLGGSAFVHGFPSRSHCFPAGHPFQQVRPCALTPLCPGVSWVHRLTDPSANLPVTHSTLLENSCCFFFFFFFDAVLCCFQSLSHVQLLVPPWTAARQASLSSTISQSLLRPTCIESAKPSDSVCILNSKRC